MKNGNNVEEAKHRVHDFWNQASCGENVYLSTNSCEGYSRQLEERYRLEPFIPLLPSSSLPKGGKCLK